jgi:tetratricopeptide (TPR) repeat protein
MRIYLSYHTQDGPRASALKQAIETAAPDMKVSFAPESLKSGHFWTPQLGEGFARADAFLMLVGDRIGPYQIIECNQALERRAAQPDFPFVPVLTSKSAPDLPRLDLLHWIEASTPEAAPGLLRIIAALRGEAVEKGRNLWRAVAPFRGLEAMREQNAAFFFGRDADAVRVIEAISRKERRIITLVGNSGAGKSSLIEAGVIPALKQRRWPGGARPWPQVLADSRQWAYLSMRPGEDPIRALLTAFMDLLYKETDGAGRIGQREKWRALIEEGRGGLTNLIDAVQARFSRELKSAPPLRVVLNIDQSEELYSLTPPPLRARFSALLAEGLSDPRFAALASLRSDYYGGLQDNRALFEATTHIDLRPLDQTQLRTVASEPARLLGARYEPQDLDALIASGAQGRHGALALLSYCVTDLWSEMQQRGDGVLRLENASEAADLAVRLSMHADRFVDAHRRDFDAVRRLFTGKLALTPEDAKPSSRRVLCSELSAEEWLLVEELTKPEWRLLVAGEEGLGGGVYVEVAHEILFEAWAALAEWLRTRRNFLIVREPDRAAPARRRSPLGVAAAVAALALAVIAAVEGWQLQRASVEREEQRARLEDEEKKVAAERKKAEAEAGRLKAKAEAALKSAKNAADALAAERRTAQAKAARLKEQAASLKEQAEAAQKAAADAASKLDSARQSAQTETERLKRQAEAAQKAAADAARKLDSERQSARTVTGRLKEQAEAAQKAAADAARKLELERQSARTETERLRRQAEAAQKSAADAAKALAEEQQNRKAEAARLQTQAESALKSAASAADALVFGAAQKFNNLQGVQQSNINEILSRALAITDELSQSGELTPELKRIRAAALLQLSDNSISLGDTDEARKQANEGAGILRKLAEEEPDNAGRQYDLAVANDKIGGVLEAQGNLNAALNAYRQGLATVERLARTGAPEQAWLRHLSWANQQVGKILEKQGNLPEAAKAYRKSLTVSEKLAGAPSASADMQSDLVWSYIRLGGALQKQGALAEALKVYHKSRTICERMAAADPASAIWRSNLKASYENLGSALKAQGELPQALDAYRRSLEIAVHMNKADPADTDWRHSLAAAYDNVGSVLEMQDAAAEALKHYQDSQRIIEGLCKADPSNASWRHDLAVSHNHVGRALKALGRLPEALKAFRESFAQREQMAAASPDNAGWRSDLAGSYRNVGEVLEAQGDVEGALAAYRNSLAIEEKLARADPSNAAWRMSLAAAYDHVGGALRAKGDLQAALKAFRSSLETRDALARSTPDDALLRREISWTHDQIASVLEKQGDLDGALKSYQEGLNVSARLADQAPNDSKRLRELATSYESMANVLKKQNNLEGALAAYENAKNLRAQLGKIDPDNAEWRKELAWTYDQAADLRQKQGASADALKTSREGLAIKESLVDGEQEDAGERLYLASGYERTAAAAKDAGQNEEALQLYGKALAIYEALMAEEPDNIEIRASSSVPLLNMGWLKGQQGEELLRRGLTILKDLQSQGKLSPRWRQSLAWAKEKLAELHAGEEARKLQESVTQEFARGRFAEALRLDEERAARIEQAEAQALGEIGPATAGAVGEIGWYALFASDYDKALKASDRALTLATDESMRLAISANRAHALMFLGRLDEARAIYAGNRGKEIAGHGLWEAVVAKDFAELRAKGVTNPQMEEIEALFKTQTSSAR